MPAGNPGELTVSEALTRFHTRYAGRGPEVWAQARRTDGRTGTGWLADRVSPAPGRRILDLACGDGALAGLLHAAGATVDGLDRCAAEIVVARDRHPGVRFHEGDARALPFADDHFDAVASHMALMLIPDGDTVAAEIDRVLAPGGTFAGVVGGGIDREEPFAADLMPALSTLIEESGLAVDYPDERWTDADLARRFPGRSVESEVMDLYQTVPVDRFGEFIALHYYGIGLLEGAAAEAAREMATDIAIRHAVDGRVRWGTRVRGFVVG